MSTYQSCPNCGSKPEGWGASHMEVYQCDNCHTSFCWRCPGSNGGRACPRCGSSRYRVVGRVYK
ncbi:MAG: zf-TFIIB domain-containing protein [Caldilineales bacterium]|nr:zf-TFIIB domain-containing protein [Caldilineales bacterium]